jgi:hypothetical protein
LELQRKRREALDDDVARQEKERVALLEQAPFSDCVGRRSIEARSPGSR